MHHCDVTSHNVYNNAGLLPRGSRGDLLNGTLSLLQFSIWCMKLILYSELANEVEGEYIVEEAT